MATTTQEKTDRFNSNNSNNRSAFSQDNSSNYYTVDDATIVLGTAKPNDEGVGEGEASPRAPPRLLQRHSASNSEDDTEPQHSPPVNYEVNSTHVAAVVADESDSDWVPSVDDDDEDEEELTCYDSDYTLLSHARDVGVKDSDKTIVNPDGSSMNVHMMDADVAKDEITGASAVTSKITENSNAAVPFRGQLY